ncbi:MAG TPA: galactokinase [Anaerolineae bacterium]|nr:galactokinase [Anaerolineae bacterium]
MAQIDPDSLHSAFQESFHSDPTIITRAPGRVNLIGEHTDYNDGFVLPVAIDRAVWIAAAACNSRLATIHALDFDQAATFRITELELRTHNGWIAYPTSRQATDLPETEPGWAAYPAGVAWSLREAGCALSGIDAVFASNVPIGAGLSSSAAVEVAFATAWEHLGGFTLRQPDLARLCQRAENDYVGVQCGIMDQTISALGRAGHALLLDCRDLSTQHIPLLAGYTLVVGDTKVGRALSSSAYNKRRQQCEEAIRSLRVHHPAIRALRDVTPEFLSRYADELPEAVRKRARHVVSENARVLESVEALRRGDVERFGRAMMASHRSLRDDYEVSCPELDVMVEAALHVEGVVGARMTGAGFGGCTVSLVRDDAVERYLNEVPDRYLSATRITPTIYVCVASNGAQVISEP